MAHRIKHPAARRPNTGDHRAPDRLLDHALAQRADFLKKYPKHIKFQEEIDIMLDKAGTAENRMAVLALLMEVKLMELQGQLHRLHRLCRDVAP